MKANGFVKKFGWDAVKTIILQQDSSLYEVIWDVEGGRFKSDCGFATLLCETNDNFVFVPHLKRLVESHDLVEFYGGIDGAKQALKTMHFDVYAKAHLKQAITDVESCL